MVRYKTPRGGGKATKVPRASLATRPRTSRNPQSPPDSSMQPESQVGTGTRSSTRERRPPALLGNYEVTDGRRPVNQHPSSATSVPAPPPPPGSQPLMIAGGDNLPGANVNETNPAGVNHVPNGAGDEAANNGVAVDDPANNRGDNLDERELAFDLHQSSASEGDSSDDYQDDSEEDEDDVEEAGR